MNRLTIGILDLIFISCATYGGFFKWGIQGGLGIVALVLVSGGLLYLGRKAVDNFRQY